MEYEKFEINLDTSEESSENDFIEDNEINIDKILAKNMVFMEEGLIKTIQKSIKIVERKYIKNNL